MRFANGLVSLSQATDSNGRRYIELLPSLIPDSFVDYDGVNISTYCAYLYNFNLDYYMYNLAMYP